MDRYLQLFFKHNSLSGHSQVHQSLDDNNIMKEKVTTGNISVGQVELWVKAEFRILTVIYFKTPIAIRFYLSLLLRAKCLLELFLVWRAAATNNFTLDLLVSYNNSCCILNSCICNNFEWGETLNLYKVNHCPSNLLVPLSLGIVSTSNNITWLEFVVNLLLVIEVQEGTKIN